MSFHPSVYLDGCDELSAPLYTYGSCEYNSPKLQVNDMVVEQREGKFLPPLNFSAAIAKREVDDGPSYQIGNWQPDQFVFASSNTVGKLSCENSSGLHVSQGSSSIFQTMASLGKRKEADLEIVGYNNVKSQQQQSRPSISSSRNQEKALGVQHKWTGKRPLAQRENHIWSERERRKGMNRLFCILRSLLPEQSTKTDKSTVVGEIIKYISLLRLRIDELSKKQSDLIQRACQSSFGKSGAATTKYQQERTLSPQSLSLVVSTPLVALHVCNDNVFINVTCSKQAWLFVNILWALRQHQLILLNGNVSTNDGQIIYCIHCKAKDINHFARESLLSALSTLVQPPPTY